MMNLWYAVYNKNNFSIWTLRKEKDSYSAPESTYYGEFRICLVIEGSAVWIIENRPYLVKQGDIIFLNVGQKRRFTSFGQDGIKLGVCSLTRNAFNGWHHFKFFVEVARKRNIITNEKLAGVLKEIYSMWDALSPLEYEFASAKLTEFFIKAETYLNFEINTQTDYQIWELMDYIDKNITKGITLVSVSEKAGISESSFSRRFVKTNGVTFKQYVIAKKVDRAIHLLHTANMKMIDVAFESGFESVSGFYTAFEKITGISPGKFLDK